MRATILRIAALALGTCALWQFGAAAYIHAKAHLAQYLIKSAWEETRGGATAVKPWSWADTWPVARLSMPSHGVDLYVLEGASGQALAFGPGRLGNSAAPGRPGNVLISAHRDTHFAFLERVQAGDEVRIETADGLHHRYRVTDTAVMHKSSLGVVLGGESEDSRLTLVTCYPFRAVDPRGPLRYVVSAVKLDARLPADL